MKSGYSSQRSAMAVVVAIASSTPARPGPSLTGSIRAFGIMWTRTVRLPLYGARGERADDEPLQDEEGDDGGNDREHARGGKHLRRGGVVGPLEIEDADGDRLQRGLTEQDEGNDKLRPA